MEKIHNLGITNRSGRQVNLLDPQYSQIDIGDIAHGLATNVDLTGKLHDFIR